MLPDPISIHTLRMEGDCTWPTGKLWPSISIHTLRMEGDMGAAVMPSSLVISIHTLRMEGDAGGGKVLQQVSDFNPHPPHGG